MDFYVMVNCFFLIRSITKFEIKLNELKHINMPNED